MLETVGAATEEARLPTAGDAGVAVAPYDNLVCAPIDIGLQSAVVGALGVQQHPMKTPNLLSRCFLMTSLIRVYTLSARGKCLTSPVYIRCKVKNSDRWIEIAIYNIASEWT